jgi:peroxiredoxin
MRECTAPEVRGSHRSRHKRLARLGALLVLLASALATHSPTDGSDTPRLLSAGDRPAVGFVLPDLSGSPLRLADVSGRVVIVHFFATWCEPCREELSSLSRLVEQIGGNRVTIIAINVAETPSRVRRFVETSPVNFPVLLDADRTVTRAWGVSLLPTTFILDRGLLARLFIEGDIDWTRSDVLHAIEQVRGGDPK